MFTLTTKSTTDSNVVKIVAKKVDCTLTISTYTSATASSVEWYKAKFTTPVDGFGQHNMNYKWQSFLVTRKDKTSTGSDAVNKISTTGKNILVGFMLNSEDASGARANSKREFFLGDTTNTAALDLFMNVFGVGLKSTAKLAVQIPAASVF